MKKLTKILSFALLAVSAFMLAACGAKTEAPVATTTKAPVATTTKAPVVTTKAPTTVAPTTTVKPVEYYENGLLKGDFENLVQPVKALGDWVAGWGNFSAGLVEVVTETDGNHALKLQPKTDGGEAAACGAFGPGVVKVGTFKVQVKVKAASGFDGSIVYGGWDSKVWTPSWPLAQFDLTGKTLSADEWTQLEATYDVAEDTTNGWVNFDIRYACTTAGDDNYILIDDVTVLKKGEDDTWTKADTNANNDFEAFDAELILNVANTWKAGNFVWVEEGSIENEFLTLDGNTVLKIYGTNQKTVKFDLGVNSAVVLPGDYRATMKVKLGAQATNVSSISFRLFGAPNPVLSAGEEFIQFNLTNLTADGWATIDAYFTVNESVTSNWVNMYFMVDLNNDEIQSTDNYILIDDVEICQAK